jgi:hypothetical protein
MITLNFDNRINFNNAINKLKNTKFKYQVKLGSCYSDFCNDKILANEEDWHNIVKIISML